MNLTREESLGYARDSLLSAIEALDRGHPEQAKAIVDKSFHKYVELALHSKPKRQRRGQEDYND